MGRKFMHLVNIWSHRQVGKAVDCKSAIHQFESGWLLHCLSIRFYLILDIISSLKYREMSEWSNVPVLKTGEGNTSGGSNPPLPASK